MKKLISLAFSVLAVVLLLQTTTLTTYADSTEPKDEDTEDTSSTTKNKVLTPDGNLTLVDDIKTKDTNNKEFLTVVSKSGNYFYIIVDRADNGEMNVHFLNLVDERDLLDLIDGETKEVESHLSSLNQHLHQNLNQLKRLNLRRINYLPH